MPNLVLGLGMAEASDGFDFFFASGRGICEIARAFDGFDTLLEEVAEAETTPELDNDKLEDFLLNDELDADDSDDP